MATIHLGIVIITGMLVLYSDEEAARWVLGKTEMMHASRVRTLHIAISIGLALLLITGGLMYVQAPAAFLSDTTFVVKMVAVAALILNTYAIERLSGIATARSFASLSIRERTPLFISGAVSVVGWITAITCGLLIS